MEALKLFQEYMGTGLIMIWFLVSLLYLWVTEKRKYIRILFVYVPLGEARWGCGLLPEESFPLQDAAPRSSFWVAVARGPQR